MEIGVGYSVDLEDSNRGLVTGVDSILPWDGA